MAINHLLRDAILNTQVNPRYAYIAPTYRQAKMIAWDYLKQFAGTIPNARFHETELRCDLPNGARIMLLGAENIHAIRGIFLDGCVMDEYADMPESMFPEVVRPALSDRKGYGIVIGTPRGMSAFYELYEAAHKRTSIGLYEHIRHHRRAYWTMKNWRVQSRRCRPISTTRNLR